MDETLRKRLEIGFALVILAVLVLFFVLGLDYPPRPRELPMIVDVIGILVVIIHLVNVLRKPAVPGKKAGATVNWRPVFLCFGTLALYLILTYFVGMVLSSAVIVYGSGMAFGARSRTKMAAAAVLTVVVIYTVFVKALGVPLYQGTLFGG